MEKSRIDRFLDMKGYQSWIKKYKKSEQYNDRQMKEWQ